MAFDPFSAKGTPLDKQKFTWRDMVGKPISKLDDDATEVYDYYGCEQHETNT